MHAPAEVTAALNVLPVELNPQVPGSSRESFGSFTWEIFVLFRIRGVLQTIAISVLNGCQWKNRQIRHDSILENSSQPSLAEPDRTDFAGCSHANAWRDSPSGIKSAYISLHESYACGSQDAKYTQIRDSDIPSARTN